MNQHTLTPTAPLRPGPTRTTHKANALVVAGALGLWPQLVRAQTPVAQPPTLPAELASSGQASTDTQARGPDAPGTAQTRLELVEEKVPVQVPVPRIEHDEAASAGTTDGDGHDDGNGSFRFLLQGTFKRTFVADSDLDSNSTIAKEQLGTVQDTDGFDIQRAFIRYTAAPSKYIQAKFLLDIAEFRHDNADQAFKLGYLKLRPTKRLQIEFGLLKRTFSLLELLPIADHELAGLGPTDTFLKDQGYAGRDIGAIFRYSPLRKKKWLTASVGFYRGDITEGYDANLLHLVTARLESFPWSKLRLGISGALRPYDNHETQKLEDDAGNSYYGEVVTMNKGKAASLDATLLLPQLQVRGEVMYGDRTDPSRAGSDHFLGAWMVLAPHFDFLGLPWVPAAKLEYLDLTPGSSGGGRTVVTAVLGVVPMEKLRVLVDLTRTWVDAGVLAMDKVPWTKGSSVRYEVEPTSTSLTAQVQYVF